MFVVCITFVDQVFQYFFSRFVCSFRVLFSLIRYLFGGGILRQSANFSRTPNHKQRRQQWVRWWLYIVFVCIAQQGTDVGQESFTQKNRKMQQIKHMKRIYRSVWCAYLIFFCGKRCAQRYFFYFLFCCLITFVQFFSLSTCK